MQTSRITDLDASFVLVDNDKQPTTTSSPNPVNVEQQWASYAHDWSPSAKLSIHGRHFVDSHGRVCQLRGVNVAGNCKTPTNDTFPDNPTTVTFVNRPFPLEEAPAHFARLRRWGLTFIRFLVTWEAVEHAGPGQYDMEYLEYLRQIISLLPEYGLSCFVALHQDVWSRYTGGSGAPAWTLEYVGFNIDALEETGAAWLNGLKVPQGVKDQHTDAPHDGEDSEGHTRGDIKKEERGLWPTGYQKLAAATMATCFWAGDTFTPKLRVQRGEEEVSIQTFLQDAFMNMYVQLAKAVGNLPAVIGFEMMNEPHRGYVELQNMHGWDYNTDLHLGPIPSPLQSFMLGAGHPTEVQYYSRSFPMPTRHTHHVLLNPEGRTVWKNGQKCIWEQHGVWGWDERTHKGVVLRESYFKKNPITGKPVDWYTDFYYPFLNKWAATVQNIAGQDKMVFVEPIPNEFCPSSWTPEHQPKNMVYAPHWYDLNALFNKAFGDFSVNVQGLSRGMFLPKALYWGHIGARDNFSLQMRNIVEAGYRSLGERPVLIGECGIPMDMNGGEAFRTDNWSWQSKMMDAMLTALDRSLIGFTLWNYNPDNSDIHGDTWNGENFSFFAQRRALPASLLSLDQTSATLDNGGRILRAFVRPYPAKVAGVPVKWNYEVNTGTCEFEWVVPYSSAEEANEEAKGAPKVDQPPLTGYPPLKSNTTEIFIPHMLTQSASVVVATPKPTGSTTSPTSTELTTTYNPAVQTLYIHQEDMTPGRRYSIQIRLDPPLKPLFPLNDLWTDYGPAITTVGVVLFAFVLAVLGLQTGAIEVRSS
ncbi:glycoside hydrolase [Panus rudis PR-1116 ss-1]|nr:glycoside hydrolase [Panus rudis PR-1116 ss-1]